MMNTKKKFEVTEVGVMAPNPTELPELSAGDVGYIAASIKDIRSCRVGDTITDADNMTAEPLPGYKKATPMVYCGIYPGEGEKYENVRDALEKLQVNDAALEFEAETSAALGFGFRCGFLGLLHMEIMQERLEREFDLNIVTTAPSVIYRVTKTDGEVVMIQNPANLPEPGEIQMIEEPIVKGDIIVPKDFVGAVMELCQERRGTMHNMESVSYTHLDVYKRQLPMWSVSG